MKMSPKEIGEAYDQIYDLWESIEFDVNNGYDQHMQAMAFAVNKGKALDVGCGCSGRFVNLLLQEGFEPEGVDVSAKMIEIARLRHPDVRFYHQDICEWVIKEKYDFITAWDSIWHIPLEQQEKVMTKLVDCLNPGGVLIFSFGGTDDPGDCVDSFMGPEIYYSTLGVNGFLKLFMSLGCHCRHFEYDQYPELHAFLIVQKPKATF